MSRTGFVARVLAPAVLAIGAAGTYLTTVRSLAAKEGTGGPPGAREVAKHLTAARAAVPRDAPVLVVTRHVPALDFDLWFGLATPVKILVPYPEDSPAPAGSSMTSAEIRAELERRGALLTESALRNALDRVRFVVFDEPRFVDEVLTMSRGRLTELLASGPVKVYRTDRP